MSSVEKMIAATKSGSVRVGNIFFEENYQFFWNKPATAAEIDALSKSAGLIIPPYYRDFLLATNGAVDYFAGANFVPCTSPLRRLRRQLSSPR